MSEIGPEYLLMIVAYCIIESAKWIAARVINHKDQLSILRDIVLQMEKMTSNNRDIALILPKILEAFNTMLISLEIVKDSQASRRDE